MNQVFQDPLVEEVRERRKKLIKNYDNDIHKIAEFLRAKEKIDSTKIVSEIKIHQEMLSIA